MMKNKTRWVWGAAFILVLIAGMWQAGKVQWLTGMGDMRGRVAGARLMKDGKLPYYYNWYPGDSLRYYYNAIVDSPRAPVKEVSSLTASPAVLQLLAPVAEFHEYQIDWGAFVLFHLFFIISIILALIYAPRHRWLLALLLLVPMILTDGWLNNFMVVQYYMLFGFMLLLICLALWRKKEIPAGILFAALVLFRFNAVVFALPFLVAGFRYRKFILTTAAALIAYGLFTLASPFQRSLWQEYFKALKEHQSMHMQENFVSTTKPYQTRIATLPMLPRNFEGQDYHRLDSLNKLYQISVYPEASSFKQGYKAVLHHYPPAWALNALLLVAVGAIWLRLFLQRIRGGTAAVPEYKYLFAGLLFYFLSSFFSTITTASYHFPQWWAVAALLAIFADRVPRVALVLFLLGVVLNFYLLPGFKGKHLMSEVCLLLSCASAVLYTRKNSDETLPAA